MDKREKQIIITAVLIVILVIVWINTFKVMREHSKKEIIESRPQLSVVRGKTLKGEPVRLTLGKGIKEDLKWIRCPFSGKIYYGGKIENIDLKLQGILWDNREPQAIINNKVIKPGDEIGPYIVVEIKQRTVVLNDGSNIFELRLGH
jgi:hypothetical protein